MIKKTAFIIVLMLMVNSLVQAQWNLVWSDEFENSSMPNSSEWLFEHGPNWYNGELQYYTNERSQNCRVENGNLVIEAINEEYEGKSYTSTRLNSKKGWKYGRFEIRAKLTDGDALWPALWLFPDEEIYGTWPKSGEIDIMEYWSWDENAIYGTIHTENYNHTNGTEKQGRIDVANLSDDFHVYAIEWYQDQIKWFVDDENFYTVYNEGSVQTYPFDHPYHLILNVAVESSAPGKEASWAKRTMEIDYVRVYEGPLQGPEKIYASIPGKIEAEDFVNAQGVKVENCAEGGKNIGYIEPNDFMEYDINVTEAGCFNFDFRLAATTVDNKLEVLIDEDLICSADIPNTNGWQSWKTISVKGDLMKGQHRMKVLSKGNFNFNWVDINNNVVGMKNKDTNSNAFRLYPNPSNGLVTIELSENIDKVAKTIVVVDGVGNTIIETEIRNGHNFQLRNLTQGLYIVMMYNGYNVLETEKLIIE